MALDRLDQAHLEGDLLVAIVLDGAARPLLDELQAPDFSVFSTLFAAIRAAGGQRDRLDEWATERLGTLHDEAGIQVLVAPTAAATELRRRARARRDAVAVEEAARELTSGAAPGDVVARLRGQLEAAHA